MDKEIKICFTSEPGVSPAGKIHDGVSIDMFGELGVLSKCVATAMCCDADVRAIILDAVAISMFADNDFSPIIHIVNAYNYHQQNSIHDDDE